MTQEWNFPEDEPVSLLVVRRYLARGGIVVGMERKPVPSIPRRRVRAHCLMNCRRSRNLTSAKVV
jgi:hypothetical protein